MNDIINIKRFALVLKKDFMENWKRYLLYFAALVGIIALIMIIRANDAYDYAKRGYSLSLIGLNKDLLAIATISFIVGGLLFASTMMDPMKGKTKRISYLIMPASNFEKYFSRWFIVSIGYIVAFFLALWLADLIRMAVCSARYPEMEVVALNLQYLIAPEEGGNEVWRQYFIPHQAFLVGFPIYVLCQSLFVLGSLFWEKLSFIKTFAVGAIILTAFILVCRWTILVFYNKDFNQFGNVLESFKFDEKVTVNQAFSIVAVIISVFAIVNWVIAYIRFKESEIIKRW